MKLELKHLAPYLPYGLKYYPSEKSDLFHDCYADNNLGISWNYTTALENKDEFAIKLSKSFLIPNQPFIAIEDGELFLGQFTSSLGFDVDDVYASEVKPILRPLHDLTKTLFQFEYGEPTTLEGWINGNCDLGALRWVLKDKAKEQRQERIIDLPYFVAEYLFQYHFDIFGMIEKGLAVDINTLEI